jgi:hypothetical protein
MCVFRKHHYNSRNANGAKNNNHPNYKLVHYNIRCVFVSNFHNLFKAHNVPTMQSVRVSQAKETFCRFSRSV